MKNPRNIVECVGYWLNYEHLCKRRELFSERYLSVPIGQFLISRHGHLVKSEYPHPFLNDSIGKKGRKASIDYVVVNKERSDIELAIETKWISSSTTLVKDIIRDLIRLELVARNCDASAYFILAGEKKSADRLFRSMAFIGDKNKPDPILPIQGREQKTLRLANCQKHKGKIITAAVELFKNVDIGKSIHVTRFGEYPRDVKYNQFVVYGWRINKRLNSTYKPKEI